MDIKLLVGQNIRKIRKYQNMTQKELANAVNLSRVSITNIEMGRQSVGLEHLHGLSIALNTPVSMLFDGLEGERNVVEGMNIKYEMLKVKHEKLQKKHQKLIENLSELIKD